MEKVLYLESDEEITSILERIKKLKAKNIGLVIPRDALILQSLVNLKLLKKETKNLKKDIVLVCPDRVGRKLAIEAGLRVSDKIDLQKIEKDLAEKEKDELEKAKEQVIKPEPEKVSPEFKPAKIEPEKPKAAEKPEKPKLKIRLNKKLLIFGAVFSIFVITFIVFLFLPKANINLVIKSEKFSRSFDLVADKNIVSPDLEKNSIPAQISETFLEKSTKAEASGKKQIGQKAKGSVKIYNYYDSDAQTLAVGTKLTKDGRVFKTTQAVTVSGVTKQAGQDVPGTATVSVEAEKEGDQYNVTAGKFAVSGYPSASFYGQSSQNMSGGYSRLITIVSQQNTDSAKDSLLNDLNNQAKDELSKKVSSDFELVDGALQTEIVEFSTDPGIDAEASEFTAAIKIKVSALVYKKSELDQLIEENFRKAVEEKEKEVVEISKDQLNKTVKNVDLAKGTMSITVSGEANVAPKLDQAKLKTSLVGKSRMEAEDYMAGFQEVESAEVELWPFWVKKIPTLTESLKINIEYTVSAEKP